MTDATKLAEIGARYEQATKGPWTVGGRLDCSSILPPSGEPIVGAGFGDCGILRPRDADFIAHAREDVPWLLEQLGKVRESAAQWGRMCARSQGRIATMRKLLKSECEICTERDEFGSCPHERPGGCSFHDTLASDAGKPEADVIAAAKRYEAEDRQFMELNRDDPWFGHYREIVIDARIKAAKDICEAVARMREGSGGAEKTTEEGGVE